MATVPLDAVKPRSNVLKVEPVTVSAVRLFVALALRLMPRDVLINWQLLNVQAPVWNDPVSKKKAWLAIPSVLEPVNEHVASGPLLYYQFMALGIPSKIDK